MKKATLFIGMFWLIIGLATAQVKVPKPSPGASVSQTIGVSKITIDYSSPGVKGRKIWGELEPFDKAWRAGANGATKITFENDVKINDKEVPAGSYSLFITPRDGKNWTVHISKGSSVFAYNKEDGTQDYAKLTADDVASVEVAPKWSEEVVERLRYIIEPVDENTANVVMKWGKAVVAFKVNIATVDVVAASLEQAKSTERGFREAASFFKDKGELEKAAELIELSISLKPNYFWNTWVKAQILAEQKSYDAALDTLKSALSYGDANPDGAYNYFKSRLEADMEAWKPNASKKWLKKNK